MPTALELTREGWKPYLEAARRRLAPSELTPTEQSERARLLAHVREAEEIIGDRLVDLIEIETAGESLQRAIERYGVEL